MTTFLVPAYNEERRIEKCISEITREFPDSGCVVVFDGNDRTPEIVRKYRQVKLIMFDKRVGKGRAIIEGLKAIGDDETVAIIDADMPVDAQDIRRAERALGDADLLVAERIFTGEPGLRLFLHHSYMAISKLFFPGLRRLPDWQGGFKLIRVSSYRKVSSEIIMNDFGFDTNLVYSFLKHRMKVVTYPVKWRHQESESKVSGNIIKVILMLLLSLMKMRVFYSPLRGFIYSKSFLVIQDKILKLLR